MNTTVHPAREAFVVILRSAWLMSRACAPICTAPISPSISALGTSAATESTHTMSTAELRTSWSTTSSAISPLSGWHMMSESTSTPSLALYLGSNACSASMSAALPPRRCTSAMACRASVVLPADSGPYTSIMRPLGYPPPSAASRVSAPLGTVSTFARVASPSLMMVPRPNVPSISSRTRASAAARADASLESADESTFEDALA
mmetsp:Transcript_13410/g.30729  ORF Transcript_13410/g.30729 Transcript_13410/m.30729 type:complete len:205 (+) Transcript_13410:608-1222(+)